jgi:hypothetical protein
MGFLNLFSRAPQPRLGRLPSGSFTVDRDGRVISYTLSQNFPAARMEEIASQVLAYFREAQRARMPAQELAVHYPALKLSARELRGGAIIFLTPQTWGRHS